MTKHQLMDKLRKEGFGDVQVVETEPNKAKPNHVHEQATVHIILKGELTIEPARNASGSVAGGDKDGKRFFREKDRVDFPAGTKHSASFGPQGCEMIVGVKN